MCEFCNYNRNIKHNQKTNKWRTGDSIWVKPHDKNEVIKEMDTNFCRNATFFELKGIYFETVYSKPKDVN